MADNRDRRRDNRYGDDGDGLTDNVISIDRVSRVVKGGRRFRFRALVVVGDQKNKVGVGVSKAGDVQSAVKKAGEKARKQMITFALDGQTIPHETDGKVAGAVIKLMPSSEGRGVKAGGTVRAVLEVTGISDITSKSIGSTNKINVAYATIDAISKLVPKSEWRGAKSSSSKTESSEETAKEAETTEESA